MDVLYSCPSNSVTSSPTMFYCVRTKCNSATVLYVLCLFLLLCVFTADFSVAASSAVSSASDSDSSASLWSLDSSSTNIGVRKSRIRITSRIRRAFVDDSVQNYLMQFGYLPPSSVHAGALRTEESLRDAIRELQAFGGIPATGELDSQTVALLKAPRCGLPDKEISLSGGRRKRYMLHGQQWHHTDLTWSLRTRDLHLDVYKVRMVLKRALEVWSKHSKLTFREVNSDKADILIEFLSGDHGDNFAFDGKGQVLAHAFFPGSGRGGDAHFDKDESWLTEDDSDSHDGTSLLQVAAHEFGHSLGLSHSSVNGALMYPFYQTSSVVELHEDDRHGIQQLYGANEDRQWAPRRDYSPPRPVTTTTTTTTTTRRPYWQQPTRSPYPEKPYPNYPHYPKENPPKKPIHPNYKPHFPTPPRKGNDDRHHGTGYYPRRYPPSTESPVVTSTARPVHRPAIGGGSGKRPTKKPPPDTCNTNYDAIAVIRREVFIFKDAYFWRIGDKGLMSGYPVEINRMWHLPTNLTHVDAVYERPKDSKIVFFIGRFYYVMNGNNVESGYPKPLSSLGLPKSLKKIDGAMVWGHNGKTYFYSGAMYWRFDEDLNRAELDYPRDMSMWKGVGTDIDAVFQWKDGRTYFFKGKGFWKFNDLYMRVEEEKQTPSGPFWMGCPQDENTNFDSNNKEPYTSISAATKLHSIIFIVNGILSSLFNLKLKNFIT